MRHALPQDALEVAGVVRRQHFGVARQVKIIQPRQPEAQRAGAQHRLPGFLLAGGKWPHRVVGGQHGLQPRSIERAAVQVDAPVVDGHRQVEQPGVAAGEIEIEESGQARAVEHHVVAEQVGMHRPVGQRLINAGGGEGFLEIDFRAQQRLPFRIQVRQHRRQRFVPPGEAAQVRLMQREILRRQVHPGQHRADFGAMLRRRVGQAVAFQLADDRRRLAVQRIQNPALMAGYRRRHQHAARGQVAHQFQVERQLLEAELFENGEDVFAALGGDEEIAVFDAGGDAADVERFSERKLGDPVTEVSQADRSKYCHEEKEKKWASARGRALHARFTRDFVRESHA